MSKKAVAIMHVSHEDAGTLEDALLARDIPRTYLQAGIDDLAPAKEADLLVVLGAPIGVYEVEDYPFLKAEFAAVEKMMARGKPVVGLCLGAQVIAAVLGSRVYPNREKEIGWGLLGLTPDGRNSPLVALGENKFRVFHWHGDTFDLPRGSTWLAETAITPNQAFSHSGGKVLGLQFHPEPRWRGLERWFIGNARALKSAGIDVKTLRADTARLGPGMEAASLKMFDTWLKQVGL
jgi:GMP synthase (glutamine-hydrolysing)